MEADNLAIVPVRAAEAGELVVLNGRQSGTRRALGVPTTFIGQAPCCDVRLNVEGVEPFHCVLTYHAGAASVRDLNSGRGTFVNGQRITTTALRDGDLLDIGPFRFRVLLPAPRPTTAAAPPSEAEHEAGANPTAALAAQQAALEEHEALLGQRWQEYAAERATFESWSAERGSELDLARVELERDRAEAQRALAQQRRDLQSEMDAERAALRAELHRQRQDATAELERERDSVRAALQHEREELEAQQQRDQDELRLAREQLAAEEQRLAKRAAALDGVRSDLQQRESALAIRQVQINTQRELDTRLLQDGWRCLQEDQERWRQRRMRENTALRARRLLLVEGERKFAEMRTAVLREKQAWETQQHAMQAELHGLNNRIVHQRQRLQEQDEVRRALAVRPDAEAPAGPPIDAALARRAAELDRLACDLADQRAQLVEQWERLARMQQDWQASRDEAVAALEILGQRLARHEDLLGHREQEIEIAESRLRLRHEQLEQTRREAALALARAEAQQQTWAAERDQVLTETTRLSDEARRQIETLDELRRKWNRRRQQEMESLRNDRHACAQLRQELSRARHDLHAHIQQLETARSTLAEEAQALQVGSGQSVETGGAGDGPNTPLRHRWLAQNAAVVRALRQQREAFAGELASLTAIEERVTVLAEQLAGAQAEMHERQTALEYREATVAAGEARLEQETRQGEQRRRYTERQLIVLQEEAEHLARALIPDTEPPSPALERAA